MRIDIMTLFPDMCETVMGESIIGRARRSGALTVKCHQIRDFAYDKHSRVDDTVYGPGKGMLMLAEPLFKCFESICNETKSRPYLVYMSPQGTVFNQEKAKELVAKNHVVLLCGHYEGIDERFIEEFVDEEISIGDFVLTGGELPALVVADSISRLAPGVLAAEECYQEESHYNGLLEYPQYTKPAVWHEKEVPSVLLSGHHQKIKQWQREQSLLRTYKKRPDLLSKTELSTEDKNFIDCLKKSE